MRTLLRRTAATTAALAAFAGGAVAMAPAAAAVNSSACNDQVANYNTEITASAVNFRTGPSTGYTSKGLVFYGQDLRVFCFRDTVAKYDWAYVEMRSGAHAGERGWVYAYYGIPMGW